MAIVGTVVRRYLPPQHIYTTGVELNRKLLNYANATESQRQETRLQMRAIVEQKFDERRMVGEIIDVIESAVHGES